MKYSSQIVTVVTVSYNAAARIEQTIQSVLRQNYPYVEYIVIDGGSTDGTVDIVKKYENQIAYWLSELDEGIYDAMNKGIDAASGGLINFMNAGDTFAGHDVVSKVLAKYSPCMDVVYGDRILVGGGEERYEKAEQLGSFYRQMPFGHQSAFIKSTLMKKHKYSTEYKLSSDYDFLLKLYHSWHKFQYVGFPVSNFLCGGLSSEKRFLSCFEALKILDKYIDNSENLEESVFMKCLGDCYNTKFSLEKPHEIEQAVLRRHGQLFNRYYKAIERLKTSSYKFIIYGNGTIGKNIYKLMPEKVEAFVDIQSNNTENVFIKGGVYHPKKISDMEFDKIIISVFGHEEEIIDYLTSELNLNADRIVTLELR